MPSRGSVASAPANVLAKLIPIRLPRSDGDPTKRPTNVDPTPDISAEVNYHRFVPLNDVASVSWRCKVGAALATVSGKSSMIF
jgi:hypothetical protein